MSPFEAQARVILEKEGTFTDMIAALSQLHESEVRKAEEKALYHVMSADTEGLFDDGELFIKRGPVEQRFIDILGYEKYKAMQEAVDASLTPQSKEDVA